MVYEYCSIDERQLDPKDQYEGTVGVTHMIQLLNQLGQEGWQAQDIHISEYGDTFRVILIRELPDAQ